MSNKIEYESLINRVFHLNKNSKLEGVFELTEPKLIN